eukprot:9488000-Pyramimonas_sp.AAC.1
MVREGGRRCVEALRRRSLAGVIVPSSFRARHRPICVEFPGMSRGSFEPSFRRAVAVRRTRGRMGGRGSG